MPPLRRRLPRTRPRLTRNGRSVLIPKKIEGVSRMRILLSSGLVFAGMVAVPYAVSPHQTYRESVPDVRHDPRLETLRRFFAKSNCPAERYSEHFLGAADDYSLDWRLLPSISY